MGKVVVGLWCFTLGMMFANWCNGPEAAARGERWGKATREWLGLPPIETMKEQGHA